jgi:hypothetical protein
VRDGAATNLSSQLMPSFFLVAHLNGAGATYKLNSTPGVAGPTEHDLYLKFKKSIRLELYNMQSQNIHVVKPVLGGQ